MGCRRRIPSSYGGANVTVGSDVEKVHRRLTEILGNEDKADGWMDAAQDGFYGKSAYELIERGQTDEVLEAIEARALS
jgi:hypothetical protein